MTKKGKIVQTPRKSRKSKSMKRKSKSMKRKVTPTSRKSKSMKRKSQKTNYQQAGRYPTKGWSKAAPKRGSQRQKVYKQCDQKGKLCFLLPNKKTPGESKFPICSTNDCNVDCRALLAAKIRAKQHNYPKVYKNANEIARKRRCSWSK